MASAKKISQLVVVPKGVRIKKFLAPSGQIPIFFLDFLLYIVHKEQLSQTILIDCGIMHTNM